MAIKVGDMITISYIERCDNAVTRTNIEEVAQENDLSNDIEGGGPLPLFVGEDFFIRGLHEEFVGKEVGAKGTVFLPAEKAYGDRDNDKIHSIERKELAREIKIGNSIHHHEYGDGTIINKIGQKYIVDFNNPLAGRDIAYEYEIHELITDPAKQFSLIVNYIFPEEIETLFENGTGIIDIGSSKPIMMVWDQMKDFIIIELFSRFSPLETLEFREKYGNPFLSFDIDQLMSFHALSGGNTFSKIADFGG